MKSRGLSSRQITVTFIILLVTACVLYLGYLFSRYHDWYLSFDPDSKEPHGTFAFKELLTSKVEKDGEFVFINKGENLTEYLPAEGDFSEEVYFSLGESHYAKQEERKRLLDFVAGGGKAVFMFRNYPETLDDIFRAAEEQKLIRLRNTLTEDTLFFGAFESLQSDFLCIREGKKGSASSFVFTNDFEASPNSFYYFEHLSPAAEKPLLYMGSPRDEDYNFLKDSTSVNELDCKQVEKYHPIMLRRKVGKGEIIVHSVPYLLTNHPLLFQEGLKHANFIASELEGRTLYWDDDARFYRYNRDRDMGPDPKGAAEKNRTILEFLLGNRELNTAYFLTLITVLLYIIFRAKRKQRIIPVLPVNENTSLAFVQNIGRIHFAQKRHKKMALLRIKLFMRYLKRHYYLDVIRQQDDRTLKQLAHKAGMTEDEIRELFNYFESISEKKSLSASELLDLDKRIQKFKNDAV